MTRRASVAMPRLVLGVDFSAAADAGRKIWITRARSVRGRLRVESCDSAAELLGCPPGAQASHAALAGFLAGCGPCAVGCDMPFSLPAPMTGGRSWPAFLAGYARRYATAQAFYRETHRRWGESRRVCDRLARTPFAPNNWRLYRQTDAALRAVLAPLVARGAVRVLPLQSPRSGLPWLLECCPASALKRLGLYRPYKGAGPRLARQRAVILRHLERAEGLVPLAPALRRRVLAQRGGDALDSIVAAWIAWRALRTPAALRPRPPGAAVEGYVYG